MPTIVANDSKKQFFFSKKHSTPEGMSEEWVPVSWVSKSRESIKATEEAYGSTEIPHPVPELQA